jgi:hypothetical protein
MTETPTEITAAGYTDIDIGAACAAWGFIEFQTAASAKIIRIATNDSRVTQSSLDTKKVVYSVALAGDDTDIAAVGLPQTFGKAAFKKLDTDGADVMATDAFSATATLASADDTLTVTISAGVLT